MATLVPDGTATNIGIPADLVIGDICVAFVSVSGSFPLVGTISAVTGGAGWAALAGGSHNTSFVWRAFWKQITGVNEPANWDQFVYAGGGTHTFHAEMLHFRNMDSAGAKRSESATDRAGNLNPLTSGSLATLARPGDVLLFTVNSKNGAGGVSPPSGYVEIMDQVSGDLWTYLAYKVATGAADASEQNASLTITPGAAADLNATYLVALRHYGGA